MLHSAPSRGLIAVVPLAVRRLAGSGLRPSPSGSLPHTQYQDDRSDQCRDQSRTLPTGCGSGIISGNASCVSVSVGRTAQALIW